MTEIRHMSIWGNHSATQFPDFYHARIGAQSAVDVIKNEKWLQEEFIPMIQKRGAKVIEARGASSAASAANSVIDALWDLYHETPEGLDYSMCRCSQGEYDIDPGLIFSMPCRTMGGVVTPVLGLQHNAFALEKIKITLEELRQEYKAVKELGLIF